MNEKFFRFFWVFYPCENVHFWYFGVNSYLLEFYWPQHNRNEIQIHMKQDTINKTMKITSSSRMYKNHTGSYLMTTFWSFVWTNVSLFQTSPTANATPSSFEMK